jgi:hypothetical protein
MLLRGTPLGTTCSRPTKNFYVVLIWYNIAIAFVKMTFLTQYYRVLQTPKMRKVCIVAMTIVGSWCLAQFLLTVFLCVPVAGFWDASIAATCIPTLPEWYQNAAGNISTDIAIFCLPLPVLGHLKLPRSQVSLHSICNSSCGAVAAALISPWYMQSYACSRLASMVPHSLPQLTSLITQKWILLGIFSLGFL